MRILKKRIEKVNEPYKISSYIKLEWKVLLVITISGIIYNIGLTAGPYFEGQLAQYLYDILNDTRPAIQMVQLAGIYLLVILFIQVMRAIKRYFVRVFANETSRNMRHMLYNSLVHMTSASLEAEGLGSIMTKAIADVDACVEGIRKFLTELFDTGIALIAYIVMLITLDYRLALLSCIFTPFAYLLANGLKKRISKTSAAYKESAGKLNQKTMDRMSNEITYRVYGCEELQDELYEERLTDYEHKAVRANVYETVMTPIYNVISMIGAIFILYFGAKNVMGTGWTAWNIASFTTFLACFTKLSIKSSKAAKLFNAVQKAEVSWKRIKPLLKDYQADDAQSAIQPNTPTSLEMKDVTINWPNGPVVLSNINLEAHAGDFIGITGEVASGKSAFGKVFIQEADYTGSITIDGRDLTSLNPYERSQCITYMGHEPQLMSDTVKDNIALGTNQSIDPYLYMASLDQEVQEMDQKEDSYVGSSGVQLSGGQQDRVALARTLMHAGSLLILDDPFSAVDHGTEDVIMDRIHDMLSDKIVFMMSHRLSHFPQCEKVIFLQDGKAIVSTHEELMKTNTAYQELFAQQVKGGDYDAQTV